MRRTLAAATCAVALLSGCADDPPAPTLPDDLVGAWHSITERGNAFSYELYRDGRYLYNGIMQDGGLRYTLQEGGRASAAGYQITFTPQQTLMTRMENGATSETRPNRPPRTLQYTIEGNRLTFTDGEGYGSIYQRG